MRVQLRSTRVQELEDGLDLEGPGNEGRIMDYGLWITKRNTR